MPHTRDRDSYSFSIRHEVLFDLYLLHGEAVLEELGFAFVVELRETISRYREQMLERAQPLTKRLQQGGEGGPPGGVICGGP